MPPLDTNTFADVVARRSCARRAAAGVGSLLLPLSLSATPTVVSAEPLLDLSPPRAGAPLDTPIGGGWRHRFDIVLTRNGDALVVRLSGQLLRVEDGGHAQQERKTRVFYLGHAG